jgi:hypothetical protein
VLGQKIGALPSPPPPECSNKLLSFGRNLTRPESVQSLGREQRWHMVHRGIGFIQRSKWSAPWEFSQELVENSFFEEKLSQIMLYGSNLILMIEETLHIIGNQKN